MKAQLIRYRSTYNLQITVSYISSNCYTKRQLKYGNLENELFKIKPLTCVKLSCHWRPWTNSAGNELSTNQTIH